MVDRRPCAAQSAQQTIGKHLVIFGYQNAHGCLLLFWGAFDRVFLPCEQF
jgi:hypothetical protein